MHITGRQGELRWGYQPVATVGPWTMTRESGNVMLSAPVVEANAFRISQRPLVFMSRNSRGAWRWPVLELQIQDGALTARLGPREL